MAVFNWAVPSEVRGETLEGPAAETPWTSSAWAGGCSQGSSGCCRDVCGVFPCQSVRLPWALIVH